MNPSENLHVKRSALNVERSAAEPAFDPTLAQPVPPTRHEPTGRTYCFVQGEHLFSATGLFVATAPAAPKPTK